MDYWQKRVRQANSLASTQSTLQRRVPLLNHSLVQRMNLDPQSLMPNEMLHLQSTMGNQAVIQMLSNQSNLHVGPTHDSHEQTAQRVAQQVSGQSSHAQRGHSTIQRATTPNLARPIGSEGGRVDKKVAAQIQSGKQGGQPVPDTVRRAVEDEIGADFGAVRVHDNRNAKQVNQALGARAFTHGKHIFLGASQSPHDVQLMAHELTHTVQQGAVSQQGTVSQGDTQQPIGQVAANQATTIQRESVAEVEDELKANKWKIRGQKTKKGALKVGGGVSEATNRLLNSPFAIVDHLSGIDRHVSDLVHYGLTGEGVDEHYPGDSERQHAKRDLGRTGLQGYVKGLKSHELKSKTGNPHMAKVPYLSGVGNPFNTFREGSLAADRNVDATKKEIGKSQKERARLKKRLLIAQAYEAMNKDSTVGTFIASGGQAATILTMVMNSRGVQAIHLPNFNSGNDEKDRMDKLAACFLSHNDRLKLKAMVG